MMDVRTKSEIYTYNGPLSAFPSIVFPFEAVSIQVTNNTTRQLYLHKTHVPASITDALITVEPRMLYNIQGWLDIHMFVGAAAPLVAGEYVTLQVSDQFNPAPAALMIESPIPTVTAGDNVVNPTTGQELAFVFGYDQVNNDWDRVRTARVDGNGLTSGVVADVPYVFDVTTNSFTPVNDLRSVPDGSDGTRNFSVGNLFYDTTTGLWFRFRSSKSTGDAADGTGHVSTGVMLFNPATSTWYRARSARTDGAHQTEGIFPSAMHAWDATAGQYVVLADARGVIDGADGTRHTPTSLMLYNPVTGSWDRARMARTDGLNQTTGALPAVLHAWDATVGQYVALADARGVVDAADGTRHIPASGLLLNPAGSWDRARASDPSGAIIPSGIQASHHHLWDNINSRFVGQVGATQDAFGVPSRLVFAVPGVVNGTGAIDRIRAAVNDGVGSIGVQAVGAMNVDPATGLYDRPLSVTADGQSYRGKPSVLPLVYNALAGTWDRLVRAHSVLQSLSGMQAMQPYLFDGNASGPEVIWRGASAPNAATFDGRGVAQVVEPGHWAMVVLGASGAFTSVTRAAVAGVRHVLRTLSVKYAVWGAAPGVTPGGQLFVRDGASGVGTIIWETSMQAQNLSGDKDGVYLSGLSLVGSVNTPMTIEIAGFGGIQTTISGTGYEAT